MRQTGFLIVLICLCTYACRDKQAGLAEEKKSADSVIFYQSNPLTNYPNQKGVVGIYDVPEMFSLCKLDSVPAKEVAQRIKDNFAALEKDLAETGAEIGGPQGIIYYNNDPGNFKFECVWLIKRISRRTPQRSMVVALEADKMLLYNYYGSYETTFNAYNEIKKYCEEHHLKQSGPMREFYSTDPANQQEVSKWLTRIMLPVKLEQDSIPK